MAYAIIDVWTTKTRDYSADKSNRDGPGGQRQRQGKQMDLQEILEDIKNKPTVPVWPHVAMAFGLSRAAAYEAAHRGEIDVMRFGRRVVAVSAPLRKRLCIEAAA
jgi:hypothetical protein